MSDRELAEDMESIVGAERHRTEHLARAVSVEQTVYILHSHECRQLFPDLRHCPWSLALDRGIDLDVWGDLQDRPVRVAVRAGRLIPARAATVIPKSDQP